MSCSDNHFPSSMTSKGSQQSAGGSHQPGFLWRKNKSRNQRCQKGNVSRTRGQDGMVDMLLLWLACANGRERFEATLPGFDQHILWVQFTPLKINIWHSNGGLVQMIFLCKWVIFLGSMLYSEVYTHLLLHARILTWWCLTISCLTRTHWICSDQIIATAHDVSPKDREGRAKGNPVIWWKSRLVNYDNVARFV